MYAPYLNLDLVCHFNGTQAALTMHVTSLGGDPMFTLFSLVSDIDQVQSIIGIWVDMAKQ